MWATKGLQILCHLGKHEQTAPTVFSIELYIFKIILYIYRKILNIYCLKILCFPTINSIMLKGELSNQPAETKVQLDRSKKRTPPGQWIFNILTIDIS